MKQMLDTPFCMEFRSGAHGSSEMVKINAKMKVGWKSLNSQRQTDNFLKKNKKSNFSKKHPDSKNVNPDSKKVSPDSKKVNPALGR